jgi:hypothetical protein
MSVSSLSSSEYAINWQNKILNNKYFIISKIDSGSYASIWIALDIEQYIYCALKINNIEDEKAGRNETSLYNLFANYKCKSIMSINNVFDHTTDDGVHHCCTMDLMACSLYTLIDTKKYSKGLGSLQHEIEAMDLINKKLAALSFGQSTKGDRTE